ncbi:ABC transporter ATP-binding protein [Nocardia alni]|uniref:ABC transporter ATP-binding protein n=1 Tax=Nocardia alni TaxID=2815723 RepID=UPI001C238408|nr:ABC transporter ATP-binding protein [Nocardia alni]
MSGLALELTGVTAGYGTTTVLRDVDLAVPPGKVVALLGANGAGKTTVLKTAAGLIRPSAGRIRLGGADVTARTPYQRSHRGLCLVPEGRGVFPNLTVRENIVLLGPQGSARDSIEKALTVFPALRGRLGHRAGDLSGGQQQMLALSRCFTGKPDVVLLDEVSMGLAPIVVDQIFEALHALARTGAALLLVEQYIGKALELADHVYLLDRGAISFSGSPAQLDEDELVRRYLHVEPDADGPADIIISGEQR